MISFAVSYRFAAAVLLLTSFSPAFANTFSAAPEPLDNDASGDGYWAEAEVIRVAARTSRREIHEPVERCVAAPAGAGREDFHRYQSTRYESPGYRSPRYRSYDERRYDERRPEGFGAAGLLGGIIGGVVGSQFGDGRGRTALTVAGAALGASIARDRANRRAPPPNPVYATPRRCTAGFRTRTVPAIEGYDVTYRYRGQNFSKWVAEHPGRTVPVRITVAPVE